MTDPSLDIPKLPGAMPLRSLSPTRVKWVQSQLALGGYLKPVAIDSVVGPNTLRAFAEWKKDAYLSDPEMIGPGSIELLAQLDIKDPVSEQAFNAKTLVLNSDAGKNQGRSVVLPLVGLVFENQWIDDKFPFFTWGELTKGLTRLPTKDSEIRNAFKLIKAVGIARSRHNRAWKVTSGFRPVEVNRRIGGAKRSTHISFRGVDVSSTDLRSMLEIARVTPEIKGIGLGQKNGFLHFDIGWQDSDRRREFGY